MTTLYRKYCKAFLDVILAVLVLIVFSWLILSLLVMYMIAFKFPIFYRHQRLGKNGKPFAMWKFRTLNNDDSLSLAERKFWLGSFLRKASLDELPQIWNILRGEMSWIGPRALPVEYSNLFSDEHRVRLEVKPGLTGWAQVNGRHSISWQKKFEFDNYYVRNLTFGLDLRIFFKTIGLVLSFKKDISLEEKPFTELKNIAIYGAGGFGRETALLIQQINAQTKHWEMIGFYDDGIIQGTKVDTWSILGGMKELQMAKEPLSIVVAVADPAIRKSIVHSLSKCHLDFPSIVHPSCQTGDANNQFGKGCILTAGVILTTGIHLGDCVIINLQTTLGHDVWIGEFTTVMPGCSISGNVKIGESCMIGTGARILQNLNVGEQCKIGAGAVVTRSFAAGKTIVGVPADEK